eukprot:530351-Heterocapsa_arctica.AAC.1
MQGPEWQALGQGFEGKDEGDPLYRKAQQVRWNRADAAKQRRKLPGREPREPEAIDQDLAELEERNS